MQGEYSRENKGITLIALVVTIVVLVILGTISITAALGDDGLLARVKESKNDYEKAKADKELEERALLNKMAEDTTKGNSEESGGGSSGGETIIYPAGTEVKKPDSWDSTKVTPVSDGKGGTIPLPDDFYYVGGDKDTGFVVSDKKGDTLDASGTSMGNQFVWIPVSSEADLTRTATNAEIKEPFEENWYSDEVAEYNTMRTQVLKYNGFYLGRYEAGRERVGVAICKKGVPPYDGAWGKSVVNGGDEDEPHALYLAKIFASQKGYTSVTSTLTYGCQWDAMCRYIGDGGRYAEEKTRYENTGSVSSDVSKNIYDLAGNCAEWTMEYCKK